MQQRRLQKSRWVLQALIKSRARVVYSKRLWFMIQGMRQKTCSARKGTGRSYGRASRQENNKENMVMVWDSGFTAGSARQDKADSLLDTLTNMGCPYG